MRTAPNIFPLADREYTKNGILSALSPGEWERFRSVVERVEIRSGSMIHEPNTPLRKVYFPLSGVISLMNIMEDGACGETAVLGNEGVEGVATFMGGEASPVWSVAQDGVTALRMQARHAREAFLRGGPFQRQILRYIQALMLQMGQVVVCNRHHTVRQRLCRWLLLSFDRIGAPDMSMTQENMANMLGVRREGVTCAARALQDEGCIRYARGRITVLDRALLENNACECYHVIRQAYPPKGGTK